MKLAVVIAIVFALFPRPLQTPMFCFTGPDGLRLCVYPHAQPLCSTDTECDALG